MPCLGCGAELDVFNESQPVCPSCGAPSGFGADQVDVTAVLEDAGLMATLVSRGDEPDFEPTGELAEAGALPLDLQLAVDDAEAMLLATGNVSFAVPGMDFLVLALPTGRVM